ncbi:MAG: RNA polymerase sigma factor [Rubrobacteraceae bacterium]|uniref:RNA polymerase sigma factor n=1 Tax=Rubrobacter naiadicus TaxID=1392641 RepID=UPI002361BF47|nr:RNA polymerase sigma factor [Rubrobacter naiadicus]MBX6762582.1 RNA polymerase sigma factor [Rubrobacteraceae bacterium]MCL6438740.1 RNA polymerase sigma factor [Rubrobacteraceae bacterium]
MSDAALVARTLSGDRKAFTRLLRRHEGSVYRVCYRILGDREDAKDATQEAFIRAYERLESFEGRSAFRTWLLRVAVNVSLNMSKKNRRESARELPPERLLGADPEPGPEQSAVSSERLEQLHRALYHLEDNHRAAVVLRDLEGLSYAEISQVLDVAEGTARVWAFRGRAKLKEILTS